MSSTCCPQFTISLEAAAFEPSKSQKQILRRFSNFVTKGGHEDQIGWGRLAPSTVLEEGTPSEGGEAAARALDSASGMDLDAQPNGQGGSMVSAVALPEGTGSTKVEPGGKKKEKKIRLSNPAFENRDEKGKEGARNHSREDPKLGGGKKGKGKSKAEDQGGDRLKQKQKRVPPVEEKKESWLGYLHAGDFGSNKEFKHHRFEYVLEPASFTEEKFQLYHLYQTSIHGEKPSKPTRSGFRHFLVDTPLDLEPTSNSSHQYGSFHAKYLLDGELIAFAVLDILPGAVSSVYFVWSPKYSALGLGKLSALREIAMVVEMRENGVVDMERYLMGYYVHSCPKMKYKAEYQPSELLDPDTNVFYSWEHCKPILDRDPHASLSGAVRPPREEQGEGTSLKTGELAETGRAEVSGSEEMRREEGGDSEEDSEMEGASEQESEEAQDNEGMDEGDDEEPSEDGYGEDSEDSEGDEGNTFPSVPPPGFLDFKNLPKEIILKSWVLQGRNLTPLIYSKAWKDEKMATEARCLLAATGEKFNNRIALWIRSDGEE